MVAPDQFKPFVPNPGTLLGRAYLAAVKDCDGVLLATEANFLRENPLLWLRAISLYANNLDFLIRQAKTRLKTSAPLSGDDQSAHVAETRRHKAWSLVQEHRLNKIKSRRAELVVELGYQDIREAYLVGDVVSALEEIAAAIDQGDIAEARRMTGLCVRRITGLTMPDQEEVGPPEPVNETVQDALSILLGKIKESGRS